jgi:hypothetical protein
MFSGLSIDVWYTANDDTGCILVSHVGKLAYYSSQVLVLHKPNITMFAQRARSLFHVLLSSCLLTCTVAMIQDVPAWDMCVHGKLVSSYWLSECSST